MVKVEVGWLLTLVFGRVRIWQSLVLALQGFRGLKASHFEEGLITEEDRPFTYSCSAKSYSQLDIDPITLFQDSQSLLIHPSNQVILSSPGSKISPR